MEGFQWRGLLAPSALPGKAAAAERRKPPACHGDNVLGGDAAEATSVVPARPEEYWKVFGAASACSIPVLELPPPSDGSGFLGCSALDYLDIFGGFDGRDFGVPYEELFFVATQESGGVGAPPPPPPAPGDPAPLPANTCMSRWSEEISCLIEEIPLPDWPGGDNIGSSSSRVVQHLSDGTKQTNMSCQMASWSSKDDPVNGTLHRNQVHAISGSTIVVEHTITKIPNNQVVTDICLCPSGSKETMKGQHLKKTVLSTSSCSNMKYLQIDMIDEPRPSKLEFSASKIAVYEQNESVISSNQSTVSRSNSASASLSNNHSLCEDIVEKKTERKWQMGTAQSTVMSVKSGNDLKVQCIASEHIPAKEALLSCSYSDHADSSSPELFPSHLAADINLDAIDARVAKANHFKKFTSPSPSCASSQSSDYDNKIEEKQFNTMSKFLEMSPVSENYRSHVSNNHSISSWRRTYPDAAFLTVSDVIFQTQPSQGPPPSRPPPARASLCSDLDACRPSANCHRATFTSHSSKQAESDVSPPCFGAGVNESSRAVASVAAVEEAMELAQVRLKSLKLPMDGKDNLQIDLKSGVSYGQRSTERDEHKAIQDNQRNTEGTVVHVAQKNNGDEVNEFATEKMTREIRVPRQAANFKDMEGNCGPIDWSLQEMKLEEVSENAFVYKGTAKKMTLTEKFMEGQKELNNQTAWGQSFDQDVNEKELEATHASCVSAEDIALTWKNQEDMSFNCMMTDESACFREGNEIEPEEAQLLFEQYKNRKSNITQQTFEEAGNEIELEAACEVCYHKGNCGKINEVQQSHGWNSNESRSNEVQELPLSPEKDHRHKDVEPSIAFVAGRPNAVEHSIVAAQGDYTQKINDGIKEVQEVLDPRQAILLGKPLQQVVLDPRRDILLGKQWHICKAGQVPIEKRGSGCLDENVSIDHETKEEVNKERIEREVPKNLQKMERDRRKLERNEWSRIKSGEKERKRTELEEEKEGERIKMEEEKDRMRRNMEEEKDWERTLEEGKERERMSRHAKDENRKCEGEEKEKKYEVKEKERRKTDEEREKDGEQERRKVEEEETETRKLDKKEGVKRKLDEERRERMKLENKAGERSKLVGDRERRLEEGEQERRKLEEKERERRTTEEEDQDTKFGQKDRRKIEEKEGEGRMEQEREMDRKMMEEEKESERINSEAEMDKEWEREDRQAVEREVHERASMGIRERAEAVAVEMVTTESQQKAVAEAQEKGEKTSAESLEKSLADMACRVAGLREEHASERAMPEAQECALGMSVGEKTTHDTRECAEKFSSTSTEGLKTNGNLSDMWDPDPQFQNLDASSSNCQGFSESFDAKSPIENLGGSKVESSIRCKARMERHQRTIERVAKALSEKNMRDIIAQREQVERNRLAETLDADVRRWSNGKEGNLRALLSTLQYILGPESGWQPIPLTDVITATAVKKAYRKAMLYVHPDKLQQRSASVQQKYICEKVFDLLKDAWNKFNSEEW